MARNIIVVTMNGINFLISLITFSITIIGLFVTFAFKYASLVGRVEALEKSHFQQMDTLNQSIDKLTTLTEKLNFTMQQNHDNVLQTIHELDKQVGILTDRNER